MIDLRHVCKKEHFMAEKKLSEELKFCLETDHCADGDCPYYEWDSAMTCKGLLQKAYERIKEYEDMEDRKNG